MPANRRQHIVAVTYQNRFANSEGEVLAIDRSNPSKRLTLKPEAIAFESYFYSVTKRDGERSHEIETGIIRKIEGDSKPAIDRMISAGLPPGSKRMEDRYDIATFIALQGIRGWDARDDMKTLKEHLIKTVVLNAPAEEIRDLYREIEGREVQSEEDDAAAREKLSRFGFNALRDEHIQSMLMVLDRLTGVVYDRSWTLLRSEGPKFLTSDAPVARWIYDRGHCRSFGEADEITIPIDRQHALLLTKGSTARSQRPASADEVLVINTRTAKFAQKWLIQHPSDTPPLSSLPPLWKLVMPEPKRRDSDPE